MSSSFRLNPALKRGKKGGNEYSLLGVTTMAAKTNLLSDRTCKNVVCGITSIHKLHDGGGLYLWVYADGRKYWRFRYRQADKEKSLSLGVFLSLD